MGRFKFAPAHNSAIYPFALSLLRLRRLFAANYFLNYPHSLFPRTINHRKSIEIGAEFSRTGVNSALYLSV
jgi:hypothetical protein